MAGELVNTRARWRLATVVACLGLSLAKFDTTPASAAPEWRNHTGYRSALLTVQEGGRTGFTRVSGQVSGIHFTNHLAEQTIATNRIYENGSGVALGDVDGDGWCDIYLCGLEGDNALYRNLGGWRFADITSEAGVACPGQYSTGAVFADVDGDRDLDLLVNAIGGGTRLFLNDGRGRFSEMTGSRLVRRFGSTSMSLADIDGDGDLDLYVTNYRTDTYRDRPPGLKVEARKVGDRIVVSPEGRFLPIAPQGGAVEVIELGERDFLYVNDGSGRFAPVSWTAGSFLDEDGRPLTAPPLDWGLAVLLRDLNQDRTPDIYVCNDFFQSLDRVWINQNSRGFRAAPRTALRNMSLSSMMVDVADINRDGHDDILVLDMLSRRHADRQRQRPEMMLGRVNPPIDDPNYRPEVPRNTLFLNRGDGTYAEIAWLSGLAATEWTWNGAFVDVDLDGYEDLLIANGNQHDVQDADALQQIASIRERESATARLARFPPLHTANLAFRNRGDLTFEEVTRAWGFGLQGVSQGMALADLDNDGDLDVVLNNLNAGAALYRNDTSAPRIAVRLKGAPPNTQGIGARIEVRGGPVPAQTQEMVCGGRYLSSDDTVRVFAAGEGNRSLTIDVWWRGGRHSRVTGVAPNCLCEIDENATEIEVSPASPNPGERAQKRVHFEDASHLLNHRHVDRPYDDFASQPLLTHRWDRLGPGVAWIETVPTAGAGSSGDAHGGYPDLVVGSGAGGSAQWFRNQRGTGFRLHAQLATGVRDFTGVAAYSPAAGEDMVLLAHANYEDPRGGPSTLQVLRANGTSTILGPTLPASMGPIALADIDGDADLDLFVGGRIAHGRYPESVGSRIYTNEGGVFVLDARRSAALEALGLVSGAVFSDLDQDGNPELLVACHWGPIRIFRNDQGQFTEITTNLGLHRYSGWWNGVTTGDFDGDGRMDIAASNWGRNSRYQLARGEKIGVRYLDFDANGTIEAIETLTDRDTGRTVPWQDLDTLSRALPFLRSAVPTYRAFGQMELDALLGDYAQSMRTLTIDTLDSMVFLNRGGHFEAIPLSIEAQFAPAFGICVADFNGDGDDDLFLAQNFFGVAPGESRYDAGLGLWLENDGHGQFRAVPASDSGIRIFGEQRGCAVADFDRDGRPDLAIAQNSGPTVLYRNAEGRPGLRVRLAGPPSNPRGIGAIVRLQFEEGAGPAREIHAGSGYGSQDSTTVVLATPRPAKAIKVHWPGGRRTVLPVQSGVREMVVPF